MTQVSLSTMKNSPYFVTFDKEINFWVKVLADIAEMIDIALQVQRQWMYLESIFMGSEDIRKQLPGSLIKIVRTNRFCNGNFVSQFPIAAEPLS